MFRDFVGQELQVGDKVVYQSGGRYPDLHKATVVGFTEKMVRIAKKGCRSTTNVYSYKLVKYIDQI